MIQQSIILYFTDDQPSSEINVSSSLAQLVLHVTNNATNDSTDILA